jgi:hypothetical protein
MDVDFFSYGIAKKQKAAHQGGSAKTKSELLISY